MARDWPGPDFTTTPSDAEAAVPPVGLTMALSLDGTVEPVRRKRPALIALGLMLIAVAIAMMIRNAQMPPSPVTSTRTSDHIITAQDGATKSTSPITAPQPVSAEQLSQLPQQTTFAQLDGVPRDPAPTQRPSGLLVHPRTAVPLYASPGGAAIAALPATQLGADTWVPVIDQQPGWVLVLLPGRPNGSAAWLYTDDPSLEQAITPYLLVVDRATFRLDLFKDGQKVNSWIVGVGKPTSPTPAGRAFILASIRETTPTFSPIVLPLSVHSDTYITYGGGPGTVGIHTWPEASVFGQADSDGCIRIPGEALQTISSEVPLGTPLLIN